MNSSLWSAVFLYNALRNLKQNIIRINFFNTHMKKIYVSPIFMVYGMSPAMLMAGTVVNGVNTNGHGDYSSSGTTFVDGTYKDGAIQPGNKGLGEDLGTDITDIVEQ